MIDLTISLLNYNGKELLKKCLESIYRETKGIIFKVYVVDNASTDGSVEMIKRDFPQVRLIENNENRYFAKAHNQVLKSVKDTEYFCLLNNDTLICDNALTNMVRAMKIRDIQIAGPMLVNKDGSNQRSCSRNPSLIYGIFQSLHINTIFPNNSVKRHKDYAEWEQIYPCAVDTVGGSCIFINSHVFNSINYLDEQFVIYWEELDLCRRASKFWKIWYLPHEKIIHYWGVDMRQHDKNKMEKIYRQSMKYYYWKHEGFIDWIIICICQYIGNIILFIKRRSRWKKSK